MGFFAWLFGKKEPVRAFKDGDKVQIYRTDRGWGSLSKKVGAIGTVVSYDDRRHIYWVDLNDGFGHWYAPARFLRRAPANSMTLAEYAEARGMSIRALCKEYGMLDSTVRMRVKRGWTVEEALNINPWDKRGKKND